MRLDDENGITPRGWITLAFCAIIVFAILAWAAITLIVEIWMTLVTL
jgi:hypothetical protein